MAKSIFRTEAELESIGQTCTRRSVCQRRARRSPGLVRQDLRRARPGEPPSSDSSRRRVNVRAVFGVTQDGKAYHRTEEKLQRIERLPQLAREGV